MNILGGHSEEDAYLLALSTVLAKAALLRNLCTDGPTTISVSRPIFAFGWQKHQQGGKEQ